jgi:hypothetical protein
MPNIFVLPENLIKECPYCGYKGGHYISDCGNYNKGIFIHIEDWFTSIHCGECTFQISRQSNVPNEKRMEEAINIWNRSINDKEFFRWFTENWFDKKLYKLNLEDWDYMEGDKLCV